MEKNINFIVKEDEKNLRVDVLINKREELISRTRIKNLILKDKLNEIDKINPQRWKSLGRRPKVNILGPTLLGFRCRDDVIEIQRILSEQGIDTNVVAPLGSSPEDIER